jgi:hypothetical protein
MKPPLNLLDPLGGVLKRVQALVKKGDCQGGLDCMYDFARSTGDPMSLSIYFLYNRKKLDKISAIIRKNKSIIPPML